ncbi:MAG: DUF2797 domain-containing protein [Pseudomonadota bacterium]
MSHHEVHVRKMRVGINDQNVAQYYLDSAEGSIHMNALIGSRISLSFDGQINCIHCGRKTKKTFNQGACFPCFRSLAQCDTCIIKPEQCHFEHGTCREPDWGQANCMQDHFVYLANTGVVKVGITRHVSNGVSSRWIDQGATQALPIFKVKSRKVSGLVEIEIAKYISDKTNWRTMLKGGYPAVDLIEFWAQLREKVKNSIDAITQEIGLQSLTELDMPALDIDFPVRRFPEKIKSLNFDKAPNIEGDLLGIKGQYLLLDGDRVLNLRNASGYNISLSSFAA